MSSTTIKTKIPASNAGETPKPTANAKVRAIIEIEYSLEDASMEDIIQEVREIADNGSNGKIKVAKVEITEPTVIDLTP